MTDFNEDLPAPEYLGMTKAEAEAHAVAVGVEDVRIVDFDDPPTMSITFDYRPRRLTLVINHGRVVRSSFF